jgi:hypothetical protein
MAQSCTGGSYSLEGFLTAEFPDITEVIALLSSAGPSCESRRGS